MPEPQPVTLRTVPAYRYREHLLCPTCAQAAILLITGLGIRETILFPLVK